MDLYVFNRVAEQEVKRLAEEAVDQRLTELEAYVQGHASALAGHEAAAGGALWRTAKGDLLRIRDMTDTHIENALVYAKSRSMQRSHPGIEKFIPLFERELERRAEVRKIDEVEARYRNGDQTAAAERARMKSERDKMRVAIFAGGPAVRDEGNGKDPVSRENLEQIITAGGGAIFPSEAVSMARELLRHRGIVSNAEVERDYLKAEVAAIRDARWEAEQCLRAVTKDRDALKAELDVAVVNVTKAEAAEQDVRWALDRVTKERDALKAKLAEGTAPVPGDVSVAALRHWAHPRWKNQRYDAHMMAREILRRRGLAENTKEAA